MQMGYTDELTAKQNCNFHGINQIMSPLKRPQVEVGSKESKKDAITPRRIQAVAVGLLPKDAPIALGAK